MSGIFEVLRHNQNDIEDNHTLTLGASIDMYDNLGFITIIEDGRVKSYKKED